MRLCDALVDNINMLAGMAQNESRILNGVFGIA